MIRINLLPVRAARRVEAGKIQLVVGGMILLAMFGGNYLWADDAQSALKRKQTAVKEAERQIKELDKIIGEVKDIQARKEDLEQKIEVISKLRKAKTGPVKVLDSLASIIPKEVWITDFTEKQGKLKMTGEALSHQDLAVFIGQLKGSPSFKDPTLKSAILKTRDGQEVVGFILTGTVDYTAGS